MKARPVPVAIVDDSSGGKCDARCGTDWSQAESRESASRALRARFGDRVKLAFFDIAQAETLPPPGLLHRIRAQGFSLPLLAIDGEPRIAGYFDIRMVSDVVEAELEMRNE
ncbi:MAG: hypothetical protein AB1603_01610 [Chloroflexota bacterium]